MNIVCFCHLRWNFVYQRPQHLMSRFAKQFNVYVVEEPVFDTREVFLEASKSKENVWILVPHLAEGATAEEQLLQQQTLLVDYFGRVGLNEFIAWYYTPMALPIGAGLPQPALVVYDCMDELSAFKNAPASLKEQETALLKMADLVFTGGHSLYEAKRHLHSDIHPFPSSIEKEHFKKARYQATEPADQKKIPVPHIGFYGVLDERLDLDLLQRMAAERPGWHFILIGPVVKIDPATLPVADNIHYPGAKSYDELPGYLSGWQVALIPFALNESTRFISPTKTPEYLAAGVPVVSTPIADVVKPYGEKQLVYIGADHNEFITGIEWALNIRDKPGWLAKVDEFLAGNSWDKTWQKMFQLIENKLVSKRSGNLKQNENEYV